MASLGRGDVILTTDGRLGIVWRSDAERVWFVPVVRGYGRRHRAELSMAECWGSLGAPLRDPVAECHRLHVKAVSAALLVGSLPEEVVAAVVSAVAREAQVRAHEERLHFSPRVSFASMAA